MEHVKRILRYKRETDGFRYKHYQVSKKWDDAQATCRQDGAHLAVIENNATRTIVHKIMPGEGWIGLTDKWTEDTWETWDRKGSPFLFWAKKEPNNQHREEHCAVKDKSNKMNDLPCHSHRHFICQF